MSRRYGLVRWALVAGLTIQGVVGLGCRSSDCGDWGTELGISSDDPLSVGLLLSDTALEPEWASPAVSVSLAHKESGSTSEVFTLEPVAGLGYFLPDTVYVQSVLYGTDAENAEPVRFAVSFSLIKGSSEDWDASAFPVISVEGGADSAELWEGWTLDLDWSGPRDYCK